MPAFLADAPRNAAPTLFAAASLAAELRLPALGRADIFCSAAPVTALLFKFADVVAFPMI